MRLGDVLRSTDTETRVGRRDTVSASTPVLLRTKPFVGGTWGPHTGWPIPNSGPKTMTNVIALRDHDRFNAEIRDRLIRTGAGAPGRKPKAADYAADVILEGLEGQFQEPEHTTTRGTPQDGIAADLSTELFAWWARRIIAWTDLSWRLASAPSLAAAASQQFRFATSTLADCRETDERIRARLRGDIANGVTANHAQRCSRKMCLVRSAPGAAGLKSTRRGDA